MTDNRNAARPRAHWWLVLAVLLTGGAVVVTQSRTADGDNGPEQPSARPAPSTAEPVSGVKSAGSGTQRAQPATRSRQHEQERSPDAVHHNAPDLADMLVRLSPEEQQLVDRYTVAGLGTGIVEAQNAYLSADAASRDEADRRYLLITNLAAKLAQPPEPLSAASAQRIAAYQHAAAEKAATMNHLSPKQRETAVQAFKDDYFHDDLAAEPKRTETLHASQD